MDEPHEPGHIHEEVRVFTLWSAGGLAIRRSDPFSGLPRRGDVGVVVIVVIKASIREEEVWYGYDWRGAQEEEGIVSQSTSCFISIHLVY